MAEYGVSPTSNAMRGENVTASDAVELPRVARDIRVGNAGDVTVVNEDGETVLFANAQPGERLGMHVKQILATGTTASSFVAYYK